MIYICCIQFLGTTRLILISKIKMKPFLLSIFSGISAFFTLKSKVGNTDNSIFITSTDHVSGRTIMIEEDAYSIWAYALKKDMQGIDFDGFLCSVTDPFVAKTDPLEATKDGNAPPLTISYANQFSYVKNLKPKDIQVSWKSHRIEIKIRKKTYLIMDLKNRVSYSKALSKDGYYGNSL